MSTRTHGMTLAPNTYHVQVAMHEGQSPMPTRSNALYAAKREMSRCLDS